MPPEAPAVTEDQPTDQIEAPENQDQPNAEVESFTDSYNPDELPEEARGAYEEAYKRLQGAYTQKTMSLAEERREAEQAQQIVTALQDPEQAPGILKIFGYDMDDEENEGLFEDDPNERIARVEQAFQAYQAEHQAVLQAAAQQDALTDQIEALEKSEGREFDPEEIRLLTQVALSNTDAKGNPNTKVAFELLSGAYTKRQEAWMKSKPKRRSPSSGTPASKAADMSNPEARRAAMVQAAEEALASTE